MQASPVQTSFALGPPSSDNSIASQRKKRSGNKKSQKCFSLLAFHFQLKIGGEGGIAALSLSLIALGWASQPSLKRTVALRDYAGALRAFVRTRGFSSPYTQNAGSRFDFQRLLSPKIGGEGGIRTPGALRHTTFPMLRHRPTRPPLQLKKSSIYSVSQLKKQFKRCERHFFIHGAPGGDRTHNLRLRRPTLYPIELQVQ